MGRNRRPMADSSRVSESGAVHKSWVGRLAIALIYPNAYSVGISNLGFQTVYRLWNEMEEVVCERMFLPEDGRPPISLESGRPLTDFDVAAFSISFENDFRHVLAMFRSAGIPFFAKQRNDSYPLVVAGGGCLFLEPRASGAVCGCIPSGRSRGTSARIRVYSPTEGGFPTGFAAPDGP